MSFTLFSWMMKTHDFNNDIIPIIIASSLITIVCSIHWPIPSRVACMCRVGRWRSIHWPMSCIRIIPLVCRCTGLGLSWCSCFSHEVLQNKQSLFHKQNLIWFGEHSVAQAKHKQNFNGKFNFFSLSQTLGDKFGRKKEVKQLEQSNGKKIMIRSSSIHILIKNFELPTLQRKKFSILQLRAEKWPNYRTLLQFFKNKIKGRE